MIFFIIFFFVLIILYNIGKKKKPTPHQYNKPTPIRHPAPDIKPNPTFLKLANEHFGPEWQKFIQSKSVNLVITNQRVREKMAFCYERLPHKDLQQLLISFILPNSHTRNYLLLHQGIYKLIVTSKFHDAGIIDFLSTLIIEHKKRPLVNNNIATNSIVIQSNSNQAMPPLVDSSIIEISPTPIKIEPKTDVSAPQYNISQTAIYNPDDYRLGTKFKNKLRLSAQEVIWLNKFSDYNNNFSAIESCNIAIIKLYLLSIKLIVRRLANEENTLTNRIESLKNAVYNFQIKQPGYWAGYGTDNIKESAESDLYYTLYKKAEAAVRVTWNHKRKISPEYPNRGAEASAIFKIELAPVMDEVVNYLLPTIGIPDEDTELQLNAMNTTRWKSRFDEIIYDHKGPNHSELIKELYKLGRENRKNPSVENIYYEASKFLVPLDKVEALKFYLHYIYQDLKSTKIDNKQINKTLLKVLFKDEEQTKAFQLIVNELIADKNLEKAILQVPSLYKTKRKTIVLNNEIIKRVEQQHTGTVEILNEYLRDEEESTDFQSPIADNITIDVGDISGEIDVVAPLTTSTVILNTIQLQFLILFKNHNFTLSPNQVEVFAKENNLFKNQLIDGINERCYDFLDDVLIEEDEEAYQVNPEYFKQISSNDN